MRLIRSIYYMTGLFAVSRGILSTNHEFVLLKDDTCPKSNTFNSQGVFEPCVDLDVDPTIGLAQASKIFSDRYESPQAQSAHEAPKSKRRAMIQSYHRTYKAIVPPIQSNTPYSAGIFQDGNDYVYFAEVSLGSKRSKMYMLLDTGADSSWVMGKDCTDPICTSRKTYGADNSSTFESSDSKFSVTYGSGSCSGILARDEVSFAGLTFKMPLGIVNTVSSEFSNFEIYGILGLSFSKSDSPSFIDSVVASKSLKSNLFAMNLSRTKDGNNTGVINFGSLDDSRYTGDMKYYHLSGKKNDWKIELSSVGFGNSQIPIGKATLMDTGATSIFAPLEDVSKVYAAIPGAKTKDDGSNWRVPCDTKDDLVFTFGSDTYSLPPSVWIGAPTATVTMCISYLSGTDKSNGEWVLGDFFLKNYYMVFDIDNRRIGIASIKTPAPSILLPSLGNESTIEDPKSSSIAFPTGDSGSNSSSTFPNTGANSTSPKKSGSFQPSVNSVFLLISQSVRFLLLWLIV